MSEQIIKVAKALCEKFIDKVETGRARSIETYAECKALLKLINENEQADAADTEITVINERGNIESGPGINGLKRDPGR